MHYVRTDGIPVVSVLRPVTACLALSVVGGVGRLENVVIVRLSATVDATLSSLHLILRYWTAAGRLPPPAVVADFFVIPRKKCLVEPSKSTMNACEFPKMFCLRYD